MVSLTAPGPTYRYLADIDKYLGDRNGRWDDDLTLDLLCLAIPDSLREAIADLLRRPIAARLAKT